MSRLIKTRFFVLVLVVLWFGRSLTMKCVSMNNQSCIVRQILTDLSPNELYYYPLITSKNRCNASYNTVEDPFGRIYVHGPRHPI